MDSDLSEGDSEFEDVDSNENQREGTVISNLDGLFHLVALMHAFAISHDFLDDDSN